MRYWFHFLRLYTEKWLSFIWQFFFLIFKELLNCFSGEGNGTPLQHSCLENPMNGGAWWATVHGVTKSWTRLSNFTFTFHFHALEKEMATHSSVLAWRIPGTREPGGLPSMGLHRVGHNWSDLAAAAVHSVFNNRRCFFLLLPPIKAPELLFIFFYPLSWGFPGGSDSKASAGNTGDPGSIPGLGRSPGEGNGNPLQYSCLENSMDWGAW